MRHLLLAALLPGRLARLRALHSAPYEWVAAESWAGAVQAIRCRPVEMAVVDPLLGGGEARAHGIQQIRSLFPSLPLLLYTELGTATARALLQLGRAGIRSVVFYRFDDAPELLRRVIHAELEQGAAHQVMLSLEGILRRLPVHVRQALAAMLHEPVVAPTVRDLAHRSRLTRRTWERQFTRVGLPPPKVIMTVMRLLYAHRLLLDPGYTVEDVARRLGYGKSKTLQTHLRGVFGITAGELRVSMSTKDVLAAVSQRYFTQLRAAAS